LIVKETKNEADIKAILLDSDIYGRMVSDSKDVISLDEVPINDDYTYIIGKENNKPFGLCIYSHEQDKTLIHFYVLKGSRYKLARKFAKEALKHKGSKPVFAVIPEYHKTVINFAVKAGFEKICNHVDPYFKKGKAYKRVILRLTV